MNTSIYLHIPFCKHRCAYCDFNTYAGQEDSIPAYVDAIIKEIEFVGRQITNLPNYQPIIHTIFFGGGTPSLLTAPQFDSILRALRSAFALTADAEISIEANPGTLSYEKLSALRETGINRISLGVQSANTEELRMLERIHDFFTVIQSVADARKAGFDNLNLDLIYGLPEQTLASWKTTLSHTVDLHPEHISAYALTLEHGTPFGRWSVKGLLPIPDPDLAAEMYEYAEEFLEANRYVHYEISNWAKKNKDEGGIMKDEKIHPSSFIPYPFFACRHNLQYWRSLPYLAFGAGAHGYTNGYRYSNALRVKTYIDRLTNSQSTNLPFPLSPATVNHHKQTLQDDISDYMINNLRLTQVGIFGSDFRSRFGIGLLDVYKKEIEELIRLGLLESKTPEVFETSEVYRLTKRGRLLGNQAFLRFVE
ncbi:oxygen-independent coproporphyrinogen III oxidase [Anaerolineales bacterium]|nr:oxygen-independent coproporphyrinogen III oxidase [Anaerolineales bacterium]